MQADLIFDQYEAHVGRVDAEFRRVSDRFSDRMQCRRGCSMCCSQMFSISLVEAAFISRAVKEMDGDKRARLQAAAREYVEKARVMIDPNRGEDDEETITPKPGLRLPCPALEGDACSIYEARPIICHKWGIPVFNPAKPSELQACELNFKPGEEVEVEGLLEPQVELLTEWVELKASARNAFEHPQVTATVAEAILNDYEAVLLESAVTVREVILVMH